MPTRSPYNLVLWSSHFPRKPLVFSAHHSGFVSSNCVRSHSKSTSHSSDPLTISGAPPAAHSMAAIKMRRTDLILSLIDRDGHFTATCSLLMMKTKMYTYSRAYIIIICLLHYVIAKHKLNDLAKYEFLSPSSSKKGFNSFQDNEEFTCKVVGFHKELRWH